MTRVLLFCKVREPAFFPNEVSQCGVAGGLRPEVVALVRLCWGCLDHAAYFSSSFFIFFTRWTPKLGPMIWWGSQRLRKKFLQQWEGVLGNDGPKVVDFFDREKSEKRSSCEPASLGDVHGCLWPYRLDCTISFYPCFVLPASFFFLFLFFFLFSFHSLPFSFFFL